MRIPPIAFAAAFAAVAGTGCASRCWIAPSVEGTVVDARSGAPLAGVEIRRTTREAAEVPVGKSASDGSFRIDAERVTVRRIPFGDPIRTGNHAFRLEGYREQRRPFALFGHDVVRDDPPAVKAGTVRLEPE